MTDPTPDDPRARLPWRAIGWGSAALILLLPAVAMRYTAEVRWGAEDFLAAALLLGLAGAVLELAFRRRRDRRWVFGVTAGVVATLLLVWAQLAVGLLH